MIHYRIKQVSDWLKHSLNWFVTKTDLYRNKTTGCLFEWLAESFIQLIYLKQWFIQEQSMWLSNWSIHLTDELKHSRTRIHRDKKNWVSLWASHWIVHWIDSFKTLIYSRRKQELKHFWAWIYSGTKQMVVFTSESLNHSFNRIKKCSNQKKFNSIDSKNKFRKETCYLLFRDAQLWNHFPWWSKNKN